MTPEAVTTIPSGADYREAEAIARKMSDADLLRLAKSLSAGQCHARELAANHEVNRRFERLRERTATLSKSVESLKEKHDALQTRFDKMLTVLQRVLTLLAGPEAWPSGPSGPRLGVPAEMRGDAAAPAAPDAPNERRPLAG
jgi:hypothetical protein